MTSEIPEDEDSGDKDLFKQSFKYYKSKWPIPTFEDVYDFDESSAPKQDVRELTLKNVSIKIPLGVIPISEWKCYEFYKSGLIFIKNPFTPQGERYWLTKCLRDYPKSPNVVNLREDIFEKHSIDDWWNSLQRCKDKFIHSKIKSAMRWTTLGYHHNWDTKVYSESMRNKFPEDLGKLIEFFANAIDFNDYSAEAAIINYYPIGTTLAGHTDHSEANLEAPLFSLSFGQTAIFLVGGQTKEEKPIAMYLKSGDIVVMSKSSRLSYHAVPKIFETNRTSWNDSLVCGLSNDEKEEEDDEPDTKKCKRKEPTEDENFYMDNELWEQCNHKEFWDPYSNYLKDSRVNINVRQVLEKGQTSL